MKATVRRSSWIVTVPLALAAVAYVVLFFLPNRRAIGQARQQARQKQEYVVQTGSLTAALRAAEQDLHRANTYTQSWQQHAPAQGELSSLYGQIHALAKAAGTTVTRFDPDPAVRHETISRIPLAMGCVGSFAEICRFLQDLEGLPATIWLKELRLDAAAGQTGEHVACELSMTVFAYNPDDSDYVEHAD